MTERRDCLLRSAVMKRAKGAVEKFSRLTTQTNSPGREKSMAVSPNGIVVFDNESTTVEVTVKTKGKKASPSGKNQSATSVNKIEGKKGSEMSVDSHNNWSKILREQNQSTLRQTMQNLAEKTPPSKLSRGGFCENQEARRSTESRKSSNYCSINKKPLNDIPLRQMSSQKKFRDHVKHSHSVNPSGMIFNNPESVIVMDKGVQCGGIFDKSNESFGQLNPVRTLGFLMKEMESLVNDETISKILTQMEQALVRIPIEQATQPDLVTIASKAKLEATTAKLAATSKTIGESYKSTLKENAILQQHIQELSSRLKQSKQRQNEMELEMKQMRLEMNEVIKSDNANKKIINDLREKTKQINALEKMVLDKNSLENELKEKRELLQQQQLEIEYLKIEKAKLSDMSSYRNSQLVELRNSIKHLQNNIADQLANMKDFPKDEEFIPPDHHSTVIEKGIACSSPTRTSSNNSIAPLSWRGVSELSLSSGNISNNNPLRSRRQSGSRQQSTGTSVAPNDSDEEKFDEKTHLEFTSIAGEQLHLLNSAINNNNNNNGDDKFIDLQSADEVDSIRKQNLSSDDEVNNKSKGKMRTHKRRKKSRTRSQLNKSNSNIQMRSSGEKTLIPSDNVFSVNSMYQDMKGQFQQMFENMKMKGRRIPVNIPEPPRNFPNPEWSDSSLPTMSITESNII